MRQGRSLESLSHELERQYDAKRDFMVPSQRVRVVDTRPAADVSKLLDELISEQQERAAKRRNEREIVERADWGLPAVELEVGGKIETFAITPHAHGQIAERLGIPHAFYSKLLTPEHREAYYPLVEHFMQRQVGKRMLRTLDGKLRADLSDAYRPLDNLDLVSAILPALMKANCRVISCDVTETRLYIKAVSMDLEGEVGDVLQHRIHKVQGGIAISNSEVGSGRLQLEGFLNVMFCTNGLFTGSSFRKTHLGSRAGDLDEASEYFSDTTRAADDAAFFGKVADVTKGLLTHEAFAKTLDRMNGQMRVEPVSDPVAAMEIVKRKYLLTDTEAVAIRNNMIRQSGDFGLGKWGLSSAITEFSKTEGLSYDRATELEQLGGRVIEMPQTDWKAVAASAAA